MTQIVGAIAALISWFAAKQVDDILGKWVAYVVIAFENSATRRAKEAYAETIGLIQKDMTKQHGSWDEWRKKAGITNADTELRIQEAGSWRSR